MLLFVVHCHILWPYFNLNSCLSLYHWTLVLWFLLLFCKPDASGADWSHLYFCLSHLVTTEPMILYMFLFGTPGNNWTIVFIYVPVCSTWPYLYFCLSHLVTTGPLVLLGFCLSQLVTTEPLILYMFLFVPPGNNWITVLIYVPVWITRPVCSYLSFNW